MHTHTHTHKHIHVHFTLCFCVYAYVREYLSPWVCIYIKKHQHKCN